MSFKMAGLIGWKDKRLQTRLFPRCLARDNIIRPILGRVESRGCYYVMFD